MDKNVAPANVNLLKMLLFGFYNFYFCFSLNLKFPSFCTRNVHLGYGILSSVLFQYQIIFFRFTFLIHRDGSWSELDTLAMRFI